MGGLPPACTQILFGQYVRETIANWPCPKARLTSGSYWWCCVLSHCKFCHELGKLMISYNLDPHRIPNLPMPPTHSWLQATHWHMGGCLLPCLQAGALGLAPDLLLHWSPHPLGSNPSPWHRLGPLPCGKQAQLTSLILLSPRLYVEIMSDSLHLSRAIFTDWTLKKVLFPNSKLVRYTKARDKLDWKISLLGFVFCYKDGLHVIYKIEISSNGWVIEWIMIYLY